MTAKKNKIVKINLSQAQKEQVKLETGKDAEALEFQVSELEERIAPRMIVSG